MPNCAEYVRKTVVNSKLRSQQQNATVSVQKIAQLLLNIVTFCHGAALQTNHRASCGHVRHGAPRWLYFDCAMQMINNKVRYLSTWRNKVTSQATFGQFAESNAIRMEAFKKVDVLRKLVEIFQQANLSEHISGELSLLRQQCDEFITEERLRRIKSTGEWRHRAANARIFKTAVPQEPNWKIWA